MGQLPALEQKRFLFVALDVLSSTYLATIDGTVARDSASTISAVAGLVAEIVRDNTAAQGFLVSWLETGSNAFRGGIGIRRSVLAVLSEDRESLSSVLETAVNTFGGQLFIKHSPILQQEGKTDPGTRFWFLHADLESSTSTDPSTCSRICPPTSAHEVGSPPSIFSIPPWHFQQNRGLTNAGSISRNGRRRGPLQSNR